jgi:hypothetical protein
MALEELRDIDFAGAVSYFVSFARSKKDEKLERLANKLFENLSVDIVKTAKDIEDKYFQVGYKEERIVSSEIEITDRIKAWKSLLALAYATRDIAPKLGISESEAKYLYDGLVEAAKKLEDVEIPTWYAKYKAFREYGWDAHHLTLKDISLFLVPLAIYILLERR